MSSDDRHPAVEDLELTVVLAALADRARLRTVQTLAALGSSPCSDLHHAAGLSVSRSTFSHHQKILREAGIIQERIDGARRILSVRTDDLEQRFPGLLDVVVASHPVAVPTISG